MGIIQQQALRTTIISFIGIGIGMLSQMLMPFILDPEEIGALSLLNSVSTVIASIFCLGFTQITMNVFSNFRNEQNGHSGFLIFGLLFSLIGILLGIITFYGLQNFILGDSENTKLIQSISFLVFPLIFFKIIFMNMDIYMRMLYSSVIGAFLEGLVLKLIILLGLLAFYLSWINYAGVVYIYVIALAIPGVIITIAALAKTKKITIPSKDMFTIRHRKDIYKYGFFGLLATASAIIIISIDQIMLNKMVGTEAVGIYSVLFFAGLLVNVPMRGLKRASVSILSDAWSTGDLKLIQSIYTKSVVSQTIIGFYLFIIGWACLGSVLTYLPEYEAGIYVFFFIGLAQLFEVMTGVNTEIIATSSKYQVNTYLNIALAVLIIITNLFFISKWEIVGAAAASCLALLLINILRWYYLRKHFGLQPFNMKFIYSILIGVSFLLLVSSINLPFHPLIQVIVIFSVITIAYWWLIIRLALSEDINGWLLKMKNKLL